MLKPTNRISNWLRAGATSLLLLSAPCFAAEDPRVLEAVKISATGNHEKAIDLLWKALYANPESVEINRLMAKIAAEDSNHEEALFAYQRALVLNGGDPTLHYEKGRTHHALGAKRQAIEEFQWVIENSEDPRLIQECHELLKRLTRKQRHTFHGALTVKWTHDSNATSGTSSEIPDPLDNAVMQAATGRSDEVFALNGLLSHRYETHCDNLFMKNQAILAVKEYLRVNSLDVIIIKGTSGFEYLHKRWIFAVDSTHSRTYLADQLNKHSWQVGAAISNKLSKEFTLRGRARHTQKHAFNNTTGHSNTRALANLVSMDGRYKQSDKCTIVGEVVGRYSKSPATASTHSSFYQLKGRLTLLRKFSPSFSGDLTTTVHNDWYRQTHTTYTDRKRSDLNVTVRGSVSWKFHPCYLWLVEGEYAYNESNIPTSDYTAARIGTGIRGIF